MIDKNEFKNKSVLITGSSRGIGSEIAILFACLGAHVFINYNKSYKEASNVSNIITDGGGMCTLLKGDITNLDDVQSMFEVILNQTKKIDILVNNAGLLEKGPFIGVSEKKWDSSIDSNLKGAFLCSKIAARNMIKNKNGNIINVISVITNRVLNMQSSYVTAKYGLKGMTKALAKELGPFGIRVNGVSPGPVLTNMNKMSQNEIDEVVRLTPIRNMIKCEDIANAVVFLASSKARMITGQVLTIDGGLSL